MFIILSYIWQHDFCVCSQKPLSSICFNIFKYFQSKNDLLQIYLQYAMIYYFALDHLEDGGCFLIKDNKLCHLYTF